MRRSSASWRRCPVLERSWTVGVPSPCTQQVNNPGRVLSRTAAYDVKLHGKTLMTAVFITRLWFREGREGLMPKTCNLYERSPPRGDGRSVYNSWVLQPAPWLRLRVRQSSSQCQEYLRPTSRFSLTRIPRNLAPITLIGMRRSENKLDSHRRDSDAIRDYAFDQAS